MRYAFSEEQQDLRDTVRRFCAERAPMSEVRLGTQSLAGYDAQVWKQMAGELGLQGVAIPEACGGQGFGCVELGIVLAELGRCLLCAPFFSSAVLAAGVVRHVAAPAEQAAPLASIASGEVWSFAQLEPGAGWELGEVRLEARPGAEGFRLDGVKQPVPDGVDADHLLVLARQPASSGEEGLGVFVVHGDAPGLSRTALQTLDLTRRQARIELAGVRAVPLGVPGQAATGLRRALDEAAIGLACEMVGGTERVLEMAVGYARERVQFGRAIGSFQAIKHKCADVLIELEAARSLARRAAAAVDAGEPDVGLWAAAAKARCGETYLRAARENVQIHGGIGFTWEHDAHLYERRARADEQLLGDACTQRERLVAQLAQSENV